MSKKQPCVLDLQVSICTETELRLVDRCKKETRQKIVAYEDGPQETHWNMNQLLDIACILHDAPEFKTDTFRKHAHLILNLGWVLTHNPDRQKLVHALLMLMRRWLILCEQDPSCIPPPSLATLNDPQQQKVLAHMDALKRALVRERTEVAKYVQILPSVAGNLSEEEQQKLRDKSITEEQRALLKITEQAELARMKA